MGSPKLQKSTVRVQRALVGAVVVSFGILGLGACASTPKAPAHPKYILPAEIYLKVPNEPFEVLGPVRAEVTWSTADIDSDERRLCANYFNKAAQDLVRYAKQAGGDAVVDMKSVVVLFDGRIELHETPECSDDGEEGQILTQGVAIRLKSKDSTRGILDTHR